MPMSSSPITGSTSTDIKFTKLILNNKQGSGNDIAHDAVYSQIGNMPAFRKRMEARDPELIKMLGYTRKSDTDAYTELGCRIAHIYQMQRQLMATAYNICAADGIAFPRMPGGIEFTLDERVQAKAMLPMSDIRRQDLERQLKRICKCAPRQGVCMESGGNDLPVSCGQYRLCPWCRYRLVRRIAAGFKPYLADNRELCITSFKVPWNPDMDQVAYKKQYTHILNKLCVRNTQYKRDRYGKAGDFVVTLPEFIAGSDGQYRMFWKTSIVALMAKGTRIPAPVNFALRGGNAASEEILLSDGLHFRWPATSEGLKWALMQVFFWPAYMAEPGSNSMEYLMRAVHVSATRLAGDFSRLSQHPDGWIPKL